MRIVHIFPKYDSNTGDHFVQLGILKLLRERLGNFEYRGLSNKRDAPDASEPIGITKESVAAINACDLLVIGGSNLYEVSGERWGVVVEDEALASLNVPVLPIGIGSGWSFAFPQFPSMPPKVAEQVRRLHERARGSSVRDDLTARVLARQGIGPATVTGCPAGFIGEEPLRPVGRALVGVPFLPRRMFATAAWLPGKGKSPTHQRRRLMTKFFLGLLRALRDEGLEARVLVHDAGDIALARQLLGDAFVYEKDPQRMLEAVQQCDVIVGFRLHAGIAGLGFGIPPIPVLADGRNLGFAETLGLMELSVPLDPGSVGLAMERVRMALGSGRDRWSTAISRRDALGRTMRQFLEAAL